MSRKILKILSAMLAVAMLSGSTLFSSHAATAYCPGDADGDGKVTMMDVVLATRWCANWNIKIDTYNADCNHDSIVNLQDILLMKRSLAGGWNVRLGEAVLTFNVAESGARFVDGNGFTQGDAQKAILPGSTYSEADINGKTWPATPKKTGCTFKGWFTAATGGTQVTEKTIVTLKGDVTLYAHFGGYMETPEISI